MRGSAAALFTAILALGIAGCANSSACGPSTGEVADVHDGDTITLKTGEKVRYLMVDTPEVGANEECYGAEAREFNRSLVLGQTVELHYDAQCEDRYGRLLAYVFVEGHEVNSLLIQRGYACVLHIPPNGDDRVDEFQSLEDQAHSDGKGLWGYCSVTPC